MLALSMLSVALAAAPIEDPKAFACDAATDTMYANAAELPASARAALGLPDVEEPEAEIQTTGGWGGFLSACQRGNLITAIFQRGGVGTNIRFRLLRLERGAWREVPLR